MEVDTGAAATIISEETLAQKKLEMKPTQEKLRTYTGDLVKVQGIVDIVVLYEGQEVWAEFVRKRLVKKCEAWENFSKLMLMEIK